jgi:hypothetical protein
MGEACSMHDGDEKCIQRFFSENLKAGYRLEHLEVDRRIILKLYLKEIVGLYEGVNWIYLAQDRDR